MNDDFEAVYPLTPTQQGMLFHHLAHAGSGVDIEQIVCSLDEALDIERFQRAWNRVVARHQALRTRFRWEGIDEPRQEVVPEAHVALRVEDWRERSSDARERALEALLDEERARGFDLRKAPNLRVIAVRIGEQHWEVVWTFHHVICDGRSFPRVLGEVFALYDAGGDDAAAALAPVRDFGTHARHVAGLDHAPAERFWRERLAGFTAPTALPAPPVAGAASARGHVEHSVPEAVTERLRELGRTHGFSLNTAVQGAWATLLARWSGEDDVVFGATRAGRAGTVDGADEMVGCLINTLPVRARLRGDLPVAEWLHALRDSEREVRPHDQAPLMSVQGWSEVGAGQALFESLVVYDHQVLDSQMRSQGDAYARRRFRLIERTNYPLTLYAYGEPALMLRLAYDEPRFDAASAERLLEGVVHLLETIAAEPDARLDNLQLMPGEQRQRVLHEWNDTATGFADDTCIHEAIEAQAERTPDAPAVVFRDVTLSYRELNARANRLAYHLLGLGVGPDVPVALCADRGHELMVALLAIHKAGGCYVPLDPAYPRDRLAFMIADARAPVLLTQRHLEHVLPAHDARVVMLDDASVYAGRPDSNPPARVNPSNLAYVIYTSGSTGKPKGVMIEHRNVLNFFTAMDARIPVQRDADGSPGSWLAVTSLSFDISVLELFWTLARGFRVVLHEDQQRVASDAVRRGAHADRGIEFSLMYFSSADTAGEDKYRLLLEGAKFADRHGFSAVWTPERHFHEFGGLYPNPSLTTTALAMVTERVALRAGSVVGPLHHPARIAEEWAMVDNLSGGRVGIAFASGWAPRDFIFAPAAHGRKEVMLEGIDAVQKLWRGEAVEFEGPGGKTFPVTTLPRPVQPELPIWLTAAGSPDTFRNAGLRGAGVLTHLLGQSKDELAGKLEIYRSAWKEAGHEGNGHVTLMLHTFVGDDVDEVHATVRRPMINYLRSSLGLVKGFASAWTAFKKGADGTANVDVDMDSLSEEEMEGLLEYSFERYYETSGLFGDVNRALDIVDDLKGIGIDEIACLIDFGVDEDTTLAHLAQLDRVRELAQPAAHDDGGSADDQLLPAQIHRYGVTHLQCTPSLASMLVQDDQARDALGRLQVMMVGGEAFPPQLAAELRTIGVGRLLNMYGPTETTIWSAVHELTADDATVPIGTPIANTRVYVLDANLQPVPPGVAGELYIGGDGVARGYLGRPELDAERFIPDPFSDGGGRLYRTGDLVRWRDDGVLDFIGRVDHQVKIRGHRIELGEIEATLATHPAVREAVVIAREDTPGDVRLVAYMTADDPGAELPVRELREYLRERLPEPMVPSHFIALEQFPQTPNRKVDRKALPSPLDVQPAPAAASAAAASGDVSDAEARVMAIWQEALRLPGIDVDDNFFDLGGHSLLAVKVHRMLAEAFDRPLMITDLFRFPTVRSLSGYLGGDGESASLQQSQDRGAMRRQAIAARRRGRKPQTTTH